MHLHQAVDNSKSAADGANNKGLKALEEKTKEYITQKGLICSGVYFYESGRKFKLNWKKGSQKGACATKASNEGDIAACMETHKKFHAKAEGLA